MKKLRSFAGVIRKWFRCVTRINWSHAWKLTLPCAFPRGLDPFALLVSPLTVPFIFVLQLYRQYCVNQMIESLKTLTAVLDEIMAKKKKSSNVPG
jgi:hypothetical protein